MRTSLLVSLGLSLARSLGLSLALLGLGACGPMYSDPQPARAPVADPAPPGPPGGGAEPWRGDPAGAPADPYAGGGGEAAAAGRPGGAPAPDSSGPPAAGQPAAPPAPGAPRRPPAPPAPALSPEAQALLAAHNQVRARHCAAPLSWSPKLAQVAQQWADSLRSQGCKFGHSGGAYGENLAAGTSGSLDGKAVTDMWYDEIKQYAFDRGGFSMQTGHFTQVVWRETTQLGCAVTSCRGMDIWVCEYDPPGNVEGMYRQNVRAPVCR